MKKEIKIAKEVLEELYWKKKLTPREIAEKFGIKYGRTVRKKMEKYGIPRRSLSEANTKKFRRVFDGTLIERAYLLGLRAGDFHVRRMRVNTIRVQTSTTHPALFELMKKAFSRYGEPKKYYYKSKNERPDEWFIYVDLDNSFEFLIPKPELIHQNILLDDNAFNNFLAAYTDCELNWNMVQSKKKMRSIFRLRTGDIQILTQIMQKLQSYDMRPIFSMETKKGTVLPYGTFKQDMHNLTLNCRNDVKRLIRIILPLSKHSEKVRKMIFIQENWTRHWQEIKPKLDALRKEIKKEILKEVCDQPAVGHEERDKNQ